MQARHPLSPEAALGEMVRLHVRGSLPEPLWRDIILRNCRPKVGVQGRPTVCVRSNTTGVALCWSCCRVALLQAWLPEPLCWATILRGCASKVERHSWDYNVASTSACRVARSRHCGQAAVHNKLWACCIPAIAHDTRMMLPSCRRLFHKEGPHGASGSDLLSGSSA